MRNSIKKAAKGEAAALTIEHIYEHWFDFIWRNARALGAGDDIVDDVVQDVFLVIHRRLDKLYSDQELRPWLYGITRRVVADYRRRKRRKPSEMMPDEDVFLSDSGNPEVSILQKQALAAAESILRKMHPQKREVFILYVYEEMNVPEIAIALEANEDTIYSRVRAAKVDFEREAKRMRTLDQWRVG